MRPVVTFCFIRLQSVNIIISSPTRSCCFITPCHRSIRTRVHAKIIECAYHTGTFCSTVNAILCYSLLAPRPSVIAGTVTMHCS